MTLFKLIFIVSCAVYLLGVKAEISDKRLCADEDCSEPISKGRTLLKYAAAEQGMLSFGPNEVLTIYSKAAGRNMGVWGAEHKGKRGYIPKSFVKEEKVFKTDLKFLVDTEFVNKEVPSDNPVPPIKVEPDKPDTVVVDGTTIYNSDIEISSTLKEPRVVPTALPQDTVKVDTTVNKAQVDEPQKIVDSDEEHGVNQNSSVPDENDDAFNEDDDDDDCIIVEEYSEEDEESVEDINVTDKDNNLTTDNIEPEVFTNSTESDTVLNAKEANIIVNGTEPEKSQSPDDGNTNDHKNSEPETKKVPPIFEELVTEKAEMESGAPESATVKPEYDESEHTESAKKNVENESIDTTATNSHVADNTTLTSDVEEPGTTENLKAEELSTAKNVDNQSEESKSVENKVEGLVVNEKDSTHNTPDGLEVKEKDSVDNTVEELSRDSRFYKPYATSFYPRADLHSKNLDNVEDTPTSNDNHQLPTDDKEVKLETNIPLATFFDYKQSKEKEVNADNQLQQDSPDLKEQKSDNDASSSTPTDYQQLSVEKDEVSADYQLSQDASDLQEQKSETDASASTATDYQQSSVEKDENLVTESSTVILDNPTETPISRNDDPNVIEQPPVEENPIISELKEEIVSEEKQGFLSSIFDMFGGGEVKDQTEKEGAVEYVERNDDVLLSRLNDHADHCTSDPFGEYCAKAEKPAIEESFADTIVQEEESFLNTIDLHDLLKLLGVSGATIVVFLWGYIIIDKMRKEGPLIAKINNLEKALLVTTKENQILTEKLNESDVTSKDNIISNEIIEELKAELDNSNCARTVLEEQIQCLEKELENSTEVGLELNRMLTDVLSSQNGSDALMSNIEQLQNKLVEQQSTINNINANLSEKETANHELQLELEINNKKVVDLQTELDKMVENLLKIEEEKELSQNKFETQIQSLRQAASSAKQSCEAEINASKKELSDVLRKLKETQRSLELKNNEYNLLKDNVKAIGSDNDIRSLLDANSIKAEMQQLQQEKVILTEHLQQHQQIISNFETQVANMAQDLKVYRERYEEADKEKLQVITKLDVLNAYFKEKEAELQKEISKHESMWMEKQGEASSTIGRIKFMQEEIQNFKAQNESLKQEIISQEVELKSQISVLEKKAHESWVAARQAERKLEDVKQEAATLRNRLTLRERSINEDKSQNRLQSPLESNGDHPLSPLHMNVESPASPPLLYGTRDHLTTSPPLPGLPPFLPPPPGVPFIPPPIPGIPPFMPPPPSMYPGDHRPPPLGRMSSPPLNSRYSPDSRPYLHYDRNSPSPTDDEYYGISHRGYSPYNGRDNRRDYGRNTHRSNNKKGGGSSGSGNSNDSLDKINRHNSKV